MTATPMPARGPAAATMALDDKPMNGFQWLAVVICMVINMVDGFDVLVTAFAAKAISAEWALNGSQLGMLLSAGLMGMAGGSLFIAPWADRIGRRPMILGCLTVSGIGMLLSALARTPLELGALRVLTGLGVGGILACSNVIASEYASRRWRGLAVTLQSTGYALGSALGGVLAVWMIDAHGWRSIFLFGGGATLGVALLVLARLPESMDFLLTRRPPDALQRVNTLNAAVGLPALAALPARQAASGPQGSRFAQLLGPALRRPTLLVWLSFFTVMFGFYFVMSWTPKLLSASGLTGPQGVTAGVLLSLGGILGAALLGLLAARFALKRVLAGFLVITALLLSVFVSSAHPLAISYALAFLIGAFANGSVAGLYAIGPVVYPAQVRATGLGIGIGVGRLGAIVSPLVAGALIDQHWLPTQLYLGYGLAFAAAACIVMLHRLSAHDGSGAAQALKARTAH